MTRQFAERRLQELEVASSDKKNSCSPVTDNRWNQFEIWNFHVIVYFRYWSDSSTARVSKPATT